MSILILGAGGHAKVVADILLQQGASVLGFLDDDPMMWDRKPLGLPVLGTIESAHDFPSASLVHGIGSNLVRRQLAIQFRERGWQQAVHPQAIIAPSVRLGIGVVIAAGAVVNPDATIGDHTIINTCASVDHDAVIGPCAHIAPGARIAGTVHVGPGTLVGIGATVIPSRTIGAWAIIGAGATVITDIPDSVTAMGVPAIWRPISESESV